MIVKRENSVNNVPLPGTPSSIGSRLRRQKKVDQTTPNPCLRMLDGKFIDIAENCFFSTLTRMVLRC